MVSVLVVLFSIPVFAFSAYSVALLAGSFFYRDPATPLLPYIEAAPASVFLAVYNEPRVVAGTLDALLALDYPHDRLQLVVADDSTDETVGVIDGKLRDFRDSGVEVQHSRRESRGGFKAGALNHAAGKLTGEHILLIDADSRPPPGALKDGLAYMRGRGLSFVSYRVGHYNREKNLVTRAFALFQDSVDSLQKMGATRLSVPFSLQGGFVLADAAGLKEVGYWREGVLAEDADLSCRLFSAGLKGGYLSSSELPSEDPSSLRVWKRQAARVAQGWAQCLRANFTTIVRSKSLDPARKALLLLTMLSPFAALSWLTVTLSTAVAIVFGGLDPSASIFGNPLYIVAVTVPVAVFYIAGVHSLSLRKMLSLRNLALLPALSYMITSMFTISAISFVSGLAGRPGHFFRTPKGGASGESADDQGGEGTGTLVLEGLLSILAVSLSLPTFLRGGTLLGLSLFGFGAATLKSMEFSRFFMREERRTPRGGSAGQ
ncbi:MAG: glycosyltransferase [Thaumarchaeota archaeon]|nr:glycosyltransferase [Nitrososphaerota archaeon]